MLRRQPPRRVSAPQFPPDVSAHVRDEVMVRDRLRCRFCGSRRELHLHHISYRSEGVDHSPHNLITLCRHHHEVVHSDKRRWQRICRAYIWRIYVEGRPMFLLALDREFNDARPLTGTAR